MHWLDPTIKDANLDRELHVLLSIHKLLERHEFFRQLGEEALQVACEHVWMVPTSIDEVIVREKVS